MAIPDPVLKNIEENLKFVNISTENLKLFEWKPSGSYKSYVLDLNIVKENPTENIFFHIDKGNMKIVYIKNKNIIYTIGADIAVQFQLLEALLEHISKKFNEIYDINVILSYGTATDSVFKTFKSNTDEIIKSFHALDLIKSIRVHCRVCNVNVILYIKKSLIEKADSYPVPIVYSHRGHSIVCYIDQKFAVRGVELVSITG